MIFWNSQEITGGPPSSSRRMPGYSLFTEIIPSVNPFVGLVLRWCRQCMTLYFMRETTKSLAAYVTWSYVTSRIIIWATLHNVCKLCRRFRSKATAYWRGSHEVERVRCLRTAGLMCIRYPVDDREPNPSWLKRSQNDRNSWAYLPGKFRTEQIWHNLAGFRVKLLLSVASEIRVSQWNFKGLLSWRWRVIYVKSPSGMNQAYLNAGHAEGFSTSLQSDRLE